MSSTPDLLSAESLRCSAKTLKAQAKVLDGLANFALAPLAGKASARTPSPPDVYASGVAALEKAGEVDVSALRTALVDWLATEKATRRERLSGSLRAGCEMDGIELSILSKSPLELCLSPVTVRVDFDANRAEFLYSQQVLASCAADAIEILSTHREVVAALETREWNAREFHAQLLRAWRRAAPGEGWAELVDVLPELVFLRQPKAFRSDPTARRFAPYSRAQFAFDLWRLRRDRALTQDQWRLSVAPATGSATKDKKLVFWLEDDRGQGQYHLTLRFVREESHGTP